MIYTCFEMIRDCRADVPAGWRFFVRQYAPVIEKLLARYGNGEARREPVLAALRRPESGLFQILEPAPERPFVAELRQRVLAEIAQPAAEAELTLAAVEQALEPLTLVEKQAGWLEGMHYTPAETGEMLRMSALTVEKIRGRAGELIRGQVDVWNSRLLAENGRALGKAACAAAGKDCLPAKAFLDVLDGRATWRGREQMELHVRGCFNCIDYFCRLVEAVELLRRHRPLTGEQAAPLDRLLGIAEEKPGGWRRWFGGRLWGSRNRFILRSKELPCRRRCWCLPVWL